MSIIQISIAGNIASGKSTLAKLVANFLKWPIIPANAFGLTYLDKLFKYPSKWAFEAQTAFFIEKALEISNQINKGQNHIVDRCLLEDLDVYAKFFYLKGYITESQNKILEWIRELGSKSTITPSLIIYNKCNWEICAKRSLQRNGYQDQIMNTTFIKSIGDLTQKWIEEYPNTYSVPIFTIDSSVIDFRNKEIEQTILNDIQVILESIENPELNLQKTELLHQNTN
jgi:deoxyadenosine/deoxycytidine kinase